MVTDSEHQNGGSVAIAISWFFECPSPCLPQWRCTVLLYFVIFVISTL